MGKPRSQSRQIALVALVPVVLLYGTAAVSESNLERRDPPQRANTGSTPAPDMAKYADAGSWNRLWWLPEEGKVPVRGTQVAVNEAPLLYPHLIFVPPEGDDPPAGLPMIVFLHGQGESSPSPLPNVALQG